MASTTISLDSVSWSDAVHLPDDELLPPRTSNDSGHLVIAPWLAPNEPPTPPSTGKRSFNAFAKASSSARSILRSRSSTNLIKTRNSESHSIAETTSSRDSVDGQSRSLKPNGFLHTLKKKASQKFIKGSNSISESHHHASLDIPPLPTFYSSYASTSSRVFGLPPSPPPAMTSFGRTRNRRGHKKQELTNEFGAFAIPSGPELVLDTDLEKMDGIVDPSALVTTTNGRGSVGCSTTSASPTQSDWDVAQAQSSSFGTSDGGHTTTVTSTLSASPPNGLGTIFTDPFVATTSRHRTIPIPTKLSPKSLSPNPYQAGPPLIGTSVEKLSKALPLLPSTGPSDGGSTLPSWNPPESWAVHDEAQAEYDDSSSDDSMQFEGVFDDGSTTLGPSNTHTKRVGHSGRKRSIEPGSISLNTRIPQWKGKEKSTDDEGAGKSRNITGPGIVQYSIRVYRVDNKIHRVKLPLTATVQDLAANMHKRIGNSRETHRLYLQERGRERLLAPVEKPALIVKRRLEQAGYEVADRMEELGADDISFLMKFIFKSTRLGGVEEDAPAFENFEHIDLTGRSLQAIPTILHAQAHKIVSLNLSKNPLLEIPLDFIQSCENLREIRLSHMAVKKVPHSVRHSARLQRLDISCNRIVDLDDAGFDLLHLQLLKAHNNRMDKLPWYFARMQSLKFLTISNNKFDHLPAVVCELRNLVDLDISFNLLSELPEEISQLIHLERLIIVGNQISKFPAECSGLVALKELDCRRNLVADLSLVSRLPGLVTLRADHNVIHSLDFSFGPRLETLDVSHNDITKLTVLATNDGEDEDHSYTLKSLDLSHAKLSSLDDFPFHRLTSLQTLKLDYNAFRTIPDSFSSLEQLREFSCTNNFLGALPPGIGMLQKLEKVNVQHNNLKEIPASIWSCGALTSFNATSNLLKIWHDYSHEPEVQAGGGNERKPSTAGSVSTQRVPPLASSLEKLYLGDNELDEDVFAALIQLKQLRILNLCFNEIQDIPRWYFANATQLQELYLSGNKVSSIPTEDLFRMLNLRALYLNGNKLVTLPAELGKCKALETLDVGSNLLKYNINNWEFDWNWNFNARLKYLNFSGNKRFEIKPNRGQKSVPQPPNGLTVSEFAEFKELKDLRVLGLMDVLTMFVPTLPDDTDERRVRTSAKEVGGMGYGLADTLGRMDQLVMQDLVIPEFRQNKSESLFGMFGRAVSTCSSAAASKYLKDEFASAFASELDSLKPSEGIRDALRRSFLTVNKQLYNHIATGAGARKLSQVSATMGISSSSAMYKVGASGVIVYIVDKQLYTANCGDALAVMSRRGNALLISKNHNPFDRGETTRIRSAEGWVSPKGMVNDEFELSRSFGMFNILPAVNARPDIHSEELIEGDEFVIIANRGIWDYVSYQTAVDIARRNKQNPMLAAQMLRDYAISYGAEGSTMVMVVNVGDLFAAATPQGPELRGSRPKDEVADKALLRLTPEVPPPVGQVVLVFTDIRNSTHLWEVNPGMRTAMLLHNRLLRRLLRNIGGYEVKTEGDAFMVSFPSVLPALLWCLSVQIQLLAEDWPLEILESPDGKEVYDNGGTLLARGLSVRMGIHVGYPNCEPDPITGRMDYFGPMVNRSARIMGTADGGQIMCSADIVKVVQEKIPSNGAQSPFELDQSDPPMARIIDELRRIKYVFIPVGAKKMKGLEVPEMVSLVYPKELVGRHELEGPVGDDKGSMTASQPQFSVEQITQFGLLCLRLEALSTARVFRPASERRGTISPDEDEETESQILYAEPSLLLPPISGDASAAHSMLVLDMLTLRIENALSSIFLKSMTTCCDFIRGTPDVFNGVQQAT